MILINNTNKYYKLLNNKININFFLPGKFHEQRSLVGYSPRGCRGTVIEHTHTHREKYSTLNLEDQLYNNVSEFHHAIQLDTPCLLQKLQTFTIISIQNSSTNGLCPRNINRVIGSAILLLTALLTNDYFFCSLHQFFHSSTMNLVIK